MRHNFGIPLPEYDEVNTYMSKDYVPIYQVNNNANVRGRRNGNRHNNVIKRGYKDKYGYNGGDKGYGEGFANPFFDSEMYTCLNSNSNSGRSGTNDILGLLNGCIDLPGRN